MKPTSAQVLAALEQATASLVKSASISNPPADPTDKGTVSAPGHTDGDRKKTTGVDGPIGSQVTGTNAEGVLSGVATGAANTPPPVKTCDDSTGANPLAKQASELAAKIGALTNKVPAKKAAAVAGEEPPVVAGEEPPVVEGVAKTAEEISQDIPDDAEILLKVAHLVLESEEGRDVLNKIAATKYGEERARDIVSSVCETHDELMKQANYEASEAGQVELLRQQVHSDPELSDQDKLNFDRGLIVHSAALRDIQAEFSEVIEGNDDLRKKASTDEGSQELEGQFSNLVIRYQAGVALAKHAAMMMDQGGAEGAQLSPEELEQLLMELEQYTDEEKLQALQMLVQEGVIDEATAEQLAMELVGGGEGAAGGMDPNQMSPEELAALEEQMLAEQMQKSASIIDELVPLEDAGKKE